jgi:hypothetical protein
VAREYWRSLHQEHQPCLRLQLSGLPGADSRTDLPAFLFLNSRTLAVCVFRFSFRVRLFRNGEDTQERTPNILITNIFLSILVYLFFELLERRKEGNLAALIPLFIGILPGTSMENAAIGGAWSIVLAFSYRKEIGTKRLAFRACLSVLVATPFLWLWARAVPGQAILLEYGNLYMASASAFFLREFAAEVIKLGVPLLWMFCFDFRHRKFLMLIHGTLLVMYVAASPVLGSFGARHVVFRGAELIAYTTLYASLILIFQELLSQKGAAIRIPFRGTVRASLSQALTVLNSPTARKICSAGLGIIIAVYVTARFQQHLASAAELSKKGRDTPFYELADWSSKASSPSDVYITLDPDLLLNLSVYSQARAYLPQALMSYAFTPERASRLFDILKIYNVSPERIADLFPSKDVSDPTGLDLQKHLFALVMFYLKYAEVENLAGAPVIHELQNAYAAEDERQPCLRYRATHLVVSPFDQEWFDSDSFANRLIQTQPPLFENDRYKVFRIDSFLPGCQSVQP